jgi:Virulence factor
MTTTSYQIVYWRAIPAQVKAKIGRERVSKPLSDRFQVAIDDAAMRAGMIGTDDYLAEWRTAEAVEQEGEPEAVATAIITQLEAAYPNDRLKMLVENWGREL